MSWCDRSETLGTTLSSSRKLLTSKHALNVFDTTMNGGWGKSWGMLLCLSLTLLGARTVWHPFLVAATFHIGSIPSISLLNRTPLILFFGSISRPRHHNASRMPLKRFLPTLVGKFGGQLTIFDVWIMRLLILWPGWAPLISIFWSTCNLLCNVPFCFGGMCLTALIKFLFLFFKKYDTSVNDFFNSGRKC